MIKLKQLSQKRGPAPAVTRGPNHAYIPHQLPPKSQQSVHQQQVEWLDDESNVVVSSLPRERLKFTPSQVADHFRAAIAKEQAPAPVQTEPEPVLPSVQVQPTTICKSRKKLALSNNSRRSRFTPNKTIMPRLPVKIVRATNARSFQSYTPKPILPKPKEPEVIAESETESISEDGSSPAPVVPKSIPEESEAESISDDEVFCSDPTEVEAMDLVQARVAAKPIEVKPTPFQIQLQYRRSRVNPLQCEICGRILNTKSSKSMHKKTHNPPEFYCPVQGCGMPFGRKFNFQRHQAKFHH